MKDVAPPLSRRRLWLVGGAVILLIGLGGLGAYLLVHHHGGKRPPWELGLTAVTALAVLVAFLSPFLARILNRGPRPDDEESES